MDFEPLDQILEALSMGRHSFTDRIPVTVKAGEVAMIKLTDLDTLQGMLRPAHAQAYTLYYVATQLWADHNGGPADFDGPGELVRVQITMYHDQMQMVVNFRQGDSSEVLECSMCIAEPTRAERLHALHLLSGVGCPLPPCDMLLTILGLDYHYDSTAAIPFKTN